MPNDPRSSSLTPKTNVLKRTKMKGEEFAREERLTNEVASTEYTGGGKGRPALKQDRLETGE